MQIKSKNLIQMVNSRSCPLNAKRCEINQYNLCRSQLAQINSYVH